MEFEDLSLESLLEYSFDGSPDDPFLDAEKDKPVAKKRAGKGKAPAV